MSMSAPSQSRFQWFLVSFVTLGTLSLVTIWVVGITGLRVYLVGLFLILLVTSEVFPPLADGQWWRRLQVVKLVGWLITFSLLFERVIEVV
ncbi:hypothetical protein C442_15595 [Haloarcula amylolytica JCM 13557]|uniref:Uncharacterized protein n=1 Tax=Haloarcula amylolytica JCM 13557 TaxID=1227452 RepID=M0KA51_9EURY|nr:hypothetical protein C442_15595 [Haloarcula amylolytica JCM 13557]